jgi:hypothetical protein
MWYVIDTRDGRVVGSSPTRAAAYDIARNTRYIYNIPTRVNKVF